LQSLSKNYTDQTLLLERVNGEQLYWSPERHIRQDMGALEVYKAEKVHVMSKEKIRWLKNDEKRGIRNGETALVLSVNEKEMTVELMDGTEQTLDLSLKENQHWDYAYAATAHVAQGDNKLDTTAHATGGSEHAVNRPKIPQ
jgi:ATP-dependent exoDNAse (exonuclease V) alpha subunit